MCTFDCIKFQIVSIFCVFQEPATDVDMFAVSHFVRHVYCLRDSTEGYQSEPFFASYLVCQTEYVLADIISGM